MSPTGGCWGLSGSACTSPCNERLQYVRVHGARLHVALEQVCLAGVVLVHQPVLANVEAFDVLLHPVPERSAEHFFCGPFEIGPLLARHELLPLVPELEDLTGFAVGLLLLGF